MSAPTTSTSTGSRPARTPVVAASGRDPLAEAVELTRRLKLPDGWAHEVAGVGVVHLEFRSHRRCAP